MALVTFQNSMAVPTPLLMMTTKDVSLSSRYRKMTSWQKALRVMERAERPSIDLLSFQKPMSFLKARKSKKLRERQAGKHGVSSGAGWEVRCGDAWQISICVMSAGSCLLRVHVCVREKGAEQAAPVQQRHCEGEGQQVGVALQQHALKLVRLAVLLQACVDLHLEGLLDLQRHAARGH